MKKYTLRVRLAKLFKRYASKKDVESAKNIIFDTLVEEFSYPLNPIVILNELEAHQR